MPSFESSVETREIERFKAARDRAAKILDRYGSSERMTREDAEEFDAAVAEVNLARHRLQPTCTACGSTIRDDRQHTLCHACRQVSWVRREKSIKMGYYAEGETPTIDGLEAFTVQHGVLYRRGHYAVIDTLPDDLEFGVIDTRNQQTIQTIPLSRDEAWAAADALYERENEPDDRGHWLTMRNPFVAGSVVGTVLVVAAYLLAWLF